MFLEVVPTSWRNKRSINYEALQYFKLANKREQWLLQKQQKSFTAMVNGD